MIVEGFGHQHSGGDERIIVTDGTDVLIDSNAHLFRGEYTVDGQDLVISVAGSETLRIAGYFTFADPANLVSSDGAVIRGADVVRMAGATSDDRIAFLHTAEANDAEVVPAQAEASFEAIGQVDTVAGSVTVTRADGSRVTLSEGELVYQNDVVQTASGATVSLVFVDGTVFTLAQESRMVLDELIYDPDGSENSAVFNLIQGGFVFVAGQVAKTGDMDVNTPTSTIGIRGTTVEVRIVVVDGVTEVVVSLLPDWPDGALGTVDLFDQNGNFIATLSDPETSWIVSPVDGETRPVPRAQVIEADSEALLNQTYAVTERAELRVENGGNYIDFDGANSDGGGDDGGGQAVPGTGAAPETGQGNDGGTGPGQAGEQEAGEDSDGEDAGQDASPEAPELQQDETTPSPDGSAPDTDTDDDDASLQSPNETQFAQSLGVEQTAEGEAAQTTAGAATGEPGETGSETAAASDAADPAQTQSATVGGTDPGLGQGTNDVQTAGANALGSGTNAPGEGQATGQNQAAGAGTGDTNTVLAQVQAGLDAGLDDVTNFAPAFDTFGVPAFGTSDPGLGPGATAAPQTLGADPGLGDTSGIDPFATTRSFIGSIDTESAVEAVQATGVAAATDSPPVSSVVDPSIAPVAAAAVEDGATTINVLSSVSDDSATPLSLVSVGTPANGTAVISAAGEVTYTPDPDFAGTDSFSFTVENGLGGSSSGAVTVSVEPVNDAPVVEDDVVLTAQQTTIAIDVLGNDADIDSDAASLTVAVSSAPTNGTAQVVGSQILYTPDAGFFGTDSFSYTASDGTDQSAQAATVTVDVNDPPQATTDTSTVAEDGSASINVLGNDTDAEGDAITLDLVTVPSNGSAVIEPTGTITYTPDPDFSGVDSFSYTISDALGGQDTATVSVTVTPVNDDPVAADDVASTDEDAPVYIDLLTNDVDADSDTLSVTLGTPSNGSVVFDGTGFLYTPDGDFSGTDTFSYTVEDGNGGQDTGEVTVTIAAVNDAPNAIDDTGSGAEDTPVTVNVVLNDTDADGDALTVSSFSDPSNGSVALDGAGNLVYTPNSDFAGSDSFTYSVEDGNGESATGTVIVVINPVNDDPTVGEDTVGTDEDTPVTFDVLANDSDVDGDTLTVSSVTQPNNGSVVIEASGELTYSPEVGFSGIDTFTYSVDDGNGGSTTGTVTVGVAFINFEPVAADDAYRLQEDGSLSPPAASGVLSNDSDPDGDPLVVSLQVNVSNGALTLNEDGSFAYTPDADFNGVDSFTYAVADGQGGTDAATVTLQVDARNDDPVAGDDGGFSTPFNTAVDINTVDLLANDTDGDPELNQALSIQNVGSPTGGSVDLDGDTITFTPTLGFTGAASFTYEVIDGAGGVATGTVTLSVGANATPVAADDAVSTDEDTSVYTGLLDNDTDADDDALTVTLGTPTNGAVAFDGEGYLYTPDADFNGEDSFTYAIDDGNGGQDTATVTITVNPINDDPVATADSQNTNEDTGLTFDVLGNDTDVDGDGLSVVSTTDPSNGSVSIETSGELTYVPDANFTGSDSFTYTVADGNGGTSVGTVAVLVASVNDAPEAGDDTASTDEDTSVTIDVLANDTDAEGDTLTITQVGTAANGTTFIETSGEVTYTPNQGFSGTDSFTYTVSDGNGGTDTGTVSVGVAFVNFDPVAGDDTYTLSEDSSLTVSGAAGFLSNDVDPDGDPITFTIQSDVSNGTLITSDDGGFTYTPDADFNGTDSFTYLLNDGQGGAAGASVTITVNAVNDDPVPVNDGGFSTPFNASIDIDVAELLANDSDGDPELDQSVSILSVGDPVGGTVELATGIVTFTPTTGFTGAASFTYDISDEAGGTATGTVSLSVGANAAPNAVDDAVSTDEDTSVYTGLLDNDTDADDDALTVTLGAPSNGTVSFDGEGYIYTPDADFNGEDSFTYSIDDGNGGQDTATVTITVNPINDDPVANNDSVTTEEDTPITFDVLGNDTDVDGDTLSVGNVVQPANGTVTIEASGQLTYTPDADFSGTETIAYTVNDGNGGSTFASIEITTTPVNDAPTALDDEFSATENGVINGDIFTDNGNGADFDPEGGSLTLVSAQDSEGGNIRVDGVNIILPSGATLRFFGDGTFEYFPGGFSNSTTIFEELGDGESLTETFTYTVEDEAGQQSTGAVIIDVSGENDAPVTVIDQYNPTEDETVSGNALTDSTAGSADFDPEGDPFQITQIDGIDLADADENAAQAGTQYTVDDGGQLTIFADGSFAFDTAGAYEGLGDATGQLVARLQSVQYTVTDSNGASSIESLRFFVQGVNDAPDAVNDTVDTDEDTAITFDVLGNDSDAEGDDFSVTDVDQPANGTVVIEEDNSLTYTPNAGFSGPDTFTYTVADEHGAESTGSVTVNVAFVNVAPVANDDSFTLAEDTSSFSTPLATGLPANDSDADGDTLTYSVLTNVSNGVLQLFADGGFNYEPGVDFNGQDSFVYSVDDGNGGTDTATVNFTVTPVNDSPAADNDSGFTTGFNTAININAGTLLANDSDIDGDILTIVTVSDAPFGDGGTAVLDGTTVIFTPDIGFSGTSFFQYEVSDSAGGFDTALVEVVVGGNTPPVAVDDTDTTDEDTLIYLAPLSNDTDADGDALSITYDTPANGTVEFDGEGYIYTPAPDFNGTDTVGYTIDDGNGGQDSATIAITVNPVADPVIIDAVTGDDFIDAQEQTGIITVTGTAEPNGFVSLDFGGTIASFETDGDGSFSQTFNGADLPDASSFEITATSLDANGNTSGTASKTVNIEQNGTSVVTINVAGSTTSYENPSEPFGLNINNVTEAAHFDVSGPVATVRTPTTSSAEIRFTADDGRTWTYTGTDLDYDAGTGIITGIDIGSPTDDDYFSSTGQQLPVASLRAALAASVAGGTLDSTPLDALFAAAEYIYNGTNERDWIDFVDTSPNDDVFNGFGGNDEFNGWFGDDQYFLGEGNDYVFDVFGNNTVDGGAGDSDQVSYGDTNLAVDIDLNEGIATKSDGTQDTLISVEWARGGQSDDTIQMLDDLAFGRVRGFAGSDTITGGTNSFNQVAYDRDSRYTTNTTGVTVNLALGFAIDLFGDTDTLVGIQSALGSEYGDQLIGGGGDAELYGADGDDTLFSGDDNDYFELGSGEDILIYSQGFDYVQDFDIDEDTLVFSGAAQADFDSLVITDFEINSVTGAQLTFTDAQSNSYGILLEGVDVQQITEYLEFSEYFYGSDGDDTIEHPTVEGDAKITIASLGNDTYIYTNSAFGAYQELRYNELGLDGISVNLNANALNNTIDKGDAGTDTLVNVGTAARWAFGIYGTEGNDSFTIVHSTADFAWFGVYESGGDDVINLVGGNGWLRLNSGEDGEDVTADLGAGTVSSAGGTFTINNIGDTSGITLNLRTHEGNDTVIGSEGRDAIILGPGTDQADALGGYDIIQYNRFDIFDGVTVNLQTGTATGDDWDGESFTHTLSNFEEVRGSAFDDNLTAEGAGEAGVDEGDGSRLDGRDGDDSLFGGSGRDSLNGGDGDDLLDASAGTAESQGFGDSVNPGTGSNTIIGHQGHWENGDGIDLWYGDVTGSGGLVVTLGLNGSGTVVSNTPGIVNDTFTYANWLRTTDDNDTLIGADSYGAVNENFNLVAGGGDDTLIGGGGRENLRGEDGDDLLDASGGAVLNQTWGDFVQPGRGTDTVIGHQGVWEDGDGIDLSYEDLSGVGGLTFNVSNDGSGTVVSGVAGQVNDTFTFTDFFHGSQDADVFNGSDQDFEGWTGRAGNDVFNAGGGTDLLNYADDQFNGGTLGVTVNFQTGTATDGFGDTDTFNGIERVRGTPFDDTFIGSTNDESYELRQGADSLTFNGGYDFVDDFNPNEDTLTFAGDAITFIGTLDIVSRSSGPGYSFRFDDDFDGDFQTAFELTLRDVSLAEMYAILDTMTFTPVNVTGVFGSEDFYGTPEDDTIDMGGNDDGRDAAFASAGDDTYIFSSSTSTTYSQIRYNTLGDVGLTVNLDLNQATNTVDKGVAGTDTLIDAFATASGFGIGFSDGDGNDVYNITQHVSDETWVGIFQTAGNDIVNLTGGLGTLRLEVGNDGEAVSADLQVGSVTESDGDSITVNYFGDTSGSRVELETGNGDDTVFGTQFDNTFILGAGQDSADARGGYDRIRYDRNGLESGVNVSLATGIATGRWDGEEFTHTLVNFEDVRGSNFDDALIADDLGNRLDGRDGDDVLIGGAGDDNLRARDGNDLLIGNAGNDYYNVFDGANTVIFSSGNDFVDGFTVGVDQLQFAGDAAALIDVLSLNEYVFEGDTRVRFDFNDGANSFGVDFSSMTLAQANQVLASIDGQANIIVGTNGRDDVFGTNGNDTINMLGNTGQGDVANASGGDDTYVFSQSSDLGWYGVNYGGATSAGITANIDFNAQSNTVVKNGVGTDTFVDVLEAARGFFFLTGTDGDDTYNIDGHLSEETYSEVAEIRGSDVVNLTATQGSFRPKFEEAEDITVDFSGLDSGGSGVLSNGLGDTLTLNVTGSLASTSLNSWTGSGNDIFIGNDASNQVILGAGTDTADGGGGYDVIRYNRSEITTGVTVDLEAGTASGVYDGLAFSHTLSNFEEVRGSDAADQISAADTGETNMRGRGGDDILIRSDFAEDWTDGDSGRDTLLQTQSGSFDFSAFNVRDHYEQIEVLSFENGSGDGITVSLQNILDLSDTSDSLLESNFGGDASNSITVLGDIGDNLNLTDDSYSYRSTIGDGQGRTLDVYQYESGGSVLAMIAVDQDVSVDGVGVNV